MRPLGARLVLQQVDVLNSQTDSGIWLLDEDRVKYRQWVVVSVGPDVQDPTLLPGVEVIARQYGGTPVKWAGKDLVVVFEDDIYAVIT